MARRVGEGQVQRARSRPSPPTICGTQAITAGLKPSDGGSRRHAAQSGMAEEHEKGARDDRDGASGAHWAALAGDPKPWQPEAVTVASDRLVFKPQLAPVA